MPAPGGAGRAARSRCGPRPCRSRTPRTGRTASAARPSGDYRTGRRGLHPWIARALAQHVEEVRGGDRQRAQHLGACSDLHQAIAQPFSVALERRRQDSRGAAWRLDALRPVRQHVERQRRDAEGEEVGCETPVPSAAAHAQVIASYTGIADRVRSSSSEASSATPSRPLNSVRSRVEKIRVAQAFQKMRNPDADEAP